jgi:L,D-peptidoglycan transpeptidase YkuD (ErfK/YbiS/YcfS/YnhG family)
MLKREGDGATPLASMRLCYGYVRRDRGVRLGGLLPLKAARRDDGWCDAVDDRNYNRPVRLPYGASAEAICRSDRLYDVCIVLDFNLRPRRRGGGSAIFLHVAKEGMRPTLGCVAVEPAVMRRLLQHLSPRTRLDVVR